MVSIPFLHVLLWNSNPQILSVFTFSDHGHLQLPALNVCPVPVLFISVTSSHSQELNLDINVLLAPLSLSAPNHLPTDVGSGDEVGAL